MQKAKYSEGAKDSFLVIQSDHHTLAMSTLASFKLKFDKSFGEAKTQVQGGQSQNRFARLAEERRLNHLKAMHEWKGSWWPVRAPSCVELAGDHDRRGRQRTRAAAWPAARPVQRERKGESKNHKGAQRGTGRA